MSQLNSSQIQTFLNSHNNYRNNVNPPAKSMPQLVWSDDLATSASQWASQCIWNHSRAPNVGENMYLTSSRTPNISTFDTSHAVNSWGGEKPFYDYNSNSCVNGIKCRHYTQIIWANSTNIGCAVQDCPKIHLANGEEFKWSNGSTGGTIVTCQYSPQGNYIGQKPYQQY